MAETTQTWNVNKENELRCEAPEKSFLVLKLINGNAEVFGVEMVLNKEYYFIDQKFAVFTWYGCSIESRGGTSGSIYVADETRMIPYINTHVQLEARRNDAIATKTNGPRILIVGGKDCGKTTFSKVLTAYSLRMERTPVYVDLDVSLPFTGVPGSLLAFPLSKSCLNVEDGFSNFNPLIYFYGHKSPLERPELYKSLVTILAKQINERFEKDPDGKASGLIVNTQSWEEDEKSYDILYHSIETLSIDLIFVLGQDKLYAQLKEKYGKGKAIKIPTSYGAINRDKEKTRLIKTKTKEYFYGKLQYTTSLSMFSPDSKKNMPLSSFTFLNVGGLQLSDGMQSLQTNYFKLTKISPSPSLLYNVVGVLSEDIKPFPNRPNEIEQLLEINVAGFIHISDINIDDDLISFLSPNAGDLPSRILLVGSISFSE